MAIDPAVQMGVAWSEDGTLHAERSALWDFRAHRTAGARYVALLGRLKSAPIRPDVIAYEYVFLTTNTERGGEQRARWAGGWRAIVELYAEWIGAEFRPVAPASAKKALTGIGRASKQERAANPNVEKDRIRAALMWQYLDQDALERIDANRIDALCVLHWALGLPAVGELAL